MKILVTGSNGMLSKDLVLMLEKRHEVTALTKGALDITDSKGVRDTLGKIKPAVIINSAAYTNVDRAEFEKKEAYRVNKEGVKILAVVCCDIKARLVHISTDFIFDGRKNTPYSEEDQANPINVYGASKLEGELEIKKNAEDFIIIRTSWLYGRGTNNFPYKIISKAMEEETLNIVYDQVSTPTYTVDLTIAIENLLEAPAGVYHFSNEGVASRYDFAYALMDKTQKIGLKYKVKTLTPILSAEAPVKRPSYSVLDKTKYKKTTGMTIPHWTDALERYVKREYGQ